MASTSAPRKIPETVASPSDLAALTTLHASLGAELLGELLRTRFADIDALCERLQAASRRSEWRAAADIALEIADHASNLGFRALPGAARSFAAATDDKVAAHTLRNGAQMVVFEHERLRLGIQLQFPELLV